MFKTVKRKITTAEICRFTEETENYLLDEGIIARSPKTSEWLVVGQKCDIQVIEFGWYVAKEPKGNGYYRISPEKAEKLFALEGWEDHGTRYA